jgi:large subunit ribosomal protein L24
MRIRKNDMVRVIAGNDKGREGKILKVFPDSNRVIVEKVNMIKRHTRASKDVPQGGIIEKEGSIDASNVMLICPNTSKPTRIGKDVLSDGSRARVSKKSGEMLND